MSLYESRRTFQKKDTILPFSSVNNPAISHSTNGRPLYLSSHQKTIGGLTKQQLSLVILVIQNSVLVLVMRQSRRMMANPLMDDMENGSEDTQDTMYLASTAVFLAEVIKLLCCTWMFYSTTGGDLVSFLKHGLWKDVILSSGGHDLALMMVPSGLYALQNNLLYVALSHLEAATFQVTYQLKILSTAIFSMVLLGRRLDKHQWIALFLLMLGVTLVQLSTSTTINDETTTTWIGLMAVLASCISSGFAGCYFERILKSSGVSCSIWIRNVQLGICGLIFSFLGMMIYDRQRIWQDGFFQGYDGMTIWVILNQALGGLVVSMVMKYADNILKAFATSLSIILSSIISVYLFDFQPSTYFVLGTFIVLLSTYLYGQPSSSFSLKPD